MERDGQTKMKVHLRNLFKDLTHHLKEVTRVVIQEEIQVHRPSQRQVTADHKKQVQVIMLHNNNPNRVRHHR
jgi:16S rRNA U1498 N3-methylase RsmE